MRTALNLSQISPAILEGVVDVMRVDQVVTVTAKTITSALRFLHKKDIVIKSLDDYIKFKRRIMSSMGDGIHTSTFDSIEQNRNDLYTTAYDRFMRL